MRSGMKGFTMASDSTVKRSTSTLENPINLHLRLKDKSTFVAPEGTFASFKPLESAKSSVPSVVRSGYDFSYLLTRDGALWWESPHKKSTELRHEV
jgi:hypothetical protein